MKSAPKPRCLIPSAARTNDTNIARDVGPQLRHDIGGRRPDGRPQLVHRPIVQPLRDLGVAEDDKHVH